MCIKLNAIFMSSFSMFTNFIFSIALHDLLVARHDYLADGLEANLSTLTTNCYSRFLITEETYKKTMQLNATDREKVKMVLLDVQQKVKQDERKFYEFVAVLRELSCCEHLVASLQVYTDTSLEQIAVPIVLIIYVVFAEGFWGAGFSPQNILISTLNYRSPNFTVNSAPSLLGDLIWSREGRLY